MAKCKDCLHVELCARDERLPDFTPEQETLCPMFATDKKDGCKTNEDRVRVMSDRELAKLLVSGCPPNGGCYFLEPGCEQCWFEWLKLSVEDGEGDG